VNQRPWLKLDLLRDRRRLAGIPEPVIVPAASVVRQGAWYGLIPIALVIVGCSLLVLRYGWLQQQQAVLLPQAEQSDQLLARINSGASSLQRLQKSNQSLSTALLNIKTGSAFLSEISRIVPAGVQLKSVEDQGDSLMLSGFAFQPDGLAVLNGMQIRMANSLFFKPDSVVLIKAVEQNDDSAVAKILNSVANGVDLGPIETATPIAFEIRASFSAEMAAKVIPQLRELGAYGAARRVDLIRSRMIAR
jgi:Tfp pilus assembly protein PilN